MEFLYVLGVVGLFLFRAYQKYKEQQEEQATQSDKPDNYGQYTPKEKTSTAKPRKQPTSFDEIFEDMMEQAKVREQEVQARHKPTPKRKEPMLDMLGRPIESIEDGPALDSIDVRAPKAYTFSDKLTGATLNHDPTKPVMGGLTHGTKRKAKQRPFVARKAFLYKELLDRKHFTI